MTGSRAADAEIVREAVRTHYAAQARRVLNEVRPDQSAEPSRDDVCCAPAACAPDAREPSARGIGSLDIINLQQQPRPGCGTTCCTSLGGGCDPISSDLYSSDQADQVPTAALQASLGCGNPTALIDLRPGEVVLDLGSGGGIDVILSARRVGPSGQVFGVDMTDEMLTLARRNATEAGVTNVEFLKGQIEAIPLPDARVDVVISNCVINLATDKGAVLREAFRVLRPGGRFAVSDVVVDGPVPPVVQQELELWAGCIAGALPRERYQRLLQEAGFGEIEIIPTRYYTAQDLGDPDLITWFASQPPAERERLSRSFMSAFVRARKPQG